VSYFRVCPASGWMTLPKRRESMDSEGSDFARPEVLGASLIQLEVARKAREATGLYRPDFPSGEI
jgi:hypothetical protein